MISSLLFRLNQSSQAFSILLGSIIILILFYVSISEHEPFYMFNWATNVLGYSFIFIVLLLTLLSIICILNICNNNLSDRKFWFETGLQLTNLISTIALTYTLLGISIGIGELSSSNLNVETINETISQLTKQFSMAFMTSVIGLPLSGLFRCVLVICYEHSKKKLIQLSHNLIK